MVRKHQMLVPKAIHVAEIEEDASYVTVLPPKQ